MAYFTYYSIRTLAAFLLLLTVLSPVQAFSADGLTIEIHDGGDAEITFDYTLTFIERIAVYLKIADPNTELKKALESSFHVPVAIQEVTDSSSRFLVTRFATRTEKNETVVMSTPAISFSMAEKILQKYWFAPLINPDYSPTITTITYPDGYVEEFADQIDIPKTSHIMNISTVSQ